MSSQDFQINSKNFEERYLTYNPSINFLNLDIDRYINIATQEHSLPFKDFKYNATSSVFIDITKGDFLQDIYFTFTTPVLQKNGGTFACFTNTIGYALFSKIEMYIGERMILQKSSESFEMDFFMNNLQNQDNFNMVGKYTNIPLLKQNALVQKEIIVPLKLFFSEDLKKALPIYLINKQEIRFDFTIKSFSEIVNYDGFEPTSVSIINPFIRAYYTNTEDSYKEILQRQQLNKELILPIEQDMTIYNDLQENNDLYFTGPSKGIYFMIIEPDSLNNNDFFNYSSNTSNIITSIKLIIDGITIVERTNEKILRYLNSHRKLNNSYQRYIYFIPFFELKDVFSGSLNFSSTSKQTLILEFDKTQTYKIRIIHKRINFLKIFSNECQLIFN